MNKTRSELWKVCEKVGRSVEEGEGGWRVKKLKFFLMDGLSEIEFFFKQCND